MEVKLVLDNSGKPRQNYIDRIAAMPDEELRRETKQKIWLSAYANNNPRSDYHWQCDATYDEWARRDNIQGYVECYNRVIPDPFREDAP